MEILTRIDKDKFQAMSLILADALRTYFAGVHPAMTFVTAHACNTVIQDLATFYTKRGQIDRLQFWSKRHVLKQKSPAAVAFRDVANNFRHADKNSNKSYPITGQMAHTYLLATLLDFHQLKVALLEQDIIRIREVKAFNDLLIPSSRVEMPKEFWGLKWGTRPITEVEEQQFFKDRKPAIDTLSSLFYHWQSLTQPDVKQESLSLKAPTDHQLLPDEVEWIRKIGDSIQDKLHDVDANNDQAVNHRAMLKAHHLRANTRSILTGAATRHFCGLGYPPVTDYYIARITDDMSMEEADLEVSIPVEGYMLSSAPKVFLRPEYEIGLRLSA